MKINIAYRPSSLRYVEREFGFIKPMQFEFFVLKQRYGKPHFIHNRSYELKIEQITARCHMLESFLKGYWTIMLGVS